MAGVTTYPKDKPHSFWRTLPRGSDKTSSIARICNWCLGFAKFKMKISVAAADTDQARLVRDAMLTEKDLNPWFGELIRIDKYQASGPGGTMEIMSSDAATSVGLGSHLYIFDELTHWKSQSLWTSLYSGTMKTPGCVTVVITNAGYRGTWQRDLFDQCCADPDWDMYEAPGILASWVSKEKIARDRLKFPASEAMRLYDNIWVDSRTNAVFPSDSVIQMFSLRGGLPALTELPRLQDLR